MDYLLASVALLSALAAMISAWHAGQSNRRAARIERDSRIRELSLIANKVESATVRVDDLGNQLTMAYQTLFVFSGRGGGNGALKLYTQKIETEQRTLGPMRNATRETLANDIAELSDDQIKERLLKFDGYLEDLNRMREKFSVDLASVESQNQAYRQKTNT